jgi:hypothetical protein
VEIVIREGHEFGRSCVLTQQVRPQTDDPHVARHIALPHVDTIERYAGGVEMVVTRVMKLHAQHGTVRWPIEVVLSDRESGQAVMTYIFYDTETTGNGSFPTPTPHG